MSTEVKIVAGVSIVTLILVIGAAYLFGGTSAANPQNAKPVSDMKALVRKNSHEINAHSKVTLVEFGDFECPACGAEYPVVTQLLKDYKGKINFVFRNFPLPMHPNALPAAEAAEAAGAQGNFFGMYNLLYSNQNTWGGSTNPMPYFIQYAKTLHLNISRFTSDVTNKKYAARIQKDINDGYALGVDATPTFFLNGVPIQGVLPYSNFKTDINQALKSAK